MTMSKSQLPVPILGVSIVGLSIGATMPMVSLRAHQAGLSTVFIGVIAALPAVGMMLAAFLTGWLYKRANRRQIYLGCFAMSAISTLALEMGASSTPCLAVARLVMGGAAGFVIILGETWVNEAAGNTHRGRVVAVYTSCFTVFQLIGPGMVSLFGIGPEVNVMVISAHLVVLVAVWLALPAQNLPLARDVAAFSILGFLLVAPPLCVGIFFFSFFDSIILSMFPVYAVEYGYSIKLAALMVTVILLGDAFFQYPLGWLSDKVAKPKIYVGCGVLSLAMGGCLPWLMKQPSLLWPCLVALGAAAGGIYTLAIILIGERFSGAELVIANASAGFIWGLGSLLGPLASSVAMTNARGLPWVLSIAAAVCVLFSLPLFRSTPKLKTLS